MEYPGTQDPVTGEYRRTNYTRVAILYIERSNVHGPSCERLKMLLLDRVVFIFTEKLRSKSTPSIFLIPGTHTAGSLCGRRPCVRRERRLIRSVRASDRGRVPAGRGGRDTPPQTQPVQQHERGLEVPLVRRRPQRRPGDDDECAFRFFHLVHGSRYCTKRKH